MTQETLPIVFSRRRIGPPQEKADPGPTRPAQRNTRPGVLATLWLLACIAGSAEAEIYRYQGADGQWLFSDRPPAGSRGSGTGPQVWGGVGSAEAPDRDLMARLQKKFQPTTAVQACSLAVVKIEATLGTGSGFFVTTDGLILTNRHVVRPPEDWGKEQEEKLEKARQALDSAKEALALPRTRYADPEEYDKMAAWYRRNSHEYRKARLERDILRSRSAVQKTFPIQLKDGTKLMAELVAVSGNQDLALLQLKDYRTPSIAPLSERAMSQGETVYLIGSPLGVADTVSRGVFTGWHEGMLGTDGKILPGNSGGPMVTEDGKAVGINSIKITAGRDSVLDQGLGFAIPIATALAEFPVIRQGLHR
jgi:serine protease Do